MAVAIASRDADYAVTAITGGLVSLADKGAIRVIGGALEESKGVNGQKILASNQAYDAGLTDPSLLAGATYGMTQAGSSFHYMGAQIAAAEGADVSFKPLQKVGAIIGAIKTGQIDAWSIVPHIAKALAGGGAVQIIGDVVDYLPTYQVTTAFTSPQNVAQNSAKTQAFIDAFAKGARDYNAALVDRTEGEDAAEEMVCLIHNYVYTDRPYEKAAPSIRAGAMRISEGAALNMASVENQLSWFQSENLVPSGITLDQLVDTRFVETT
jgi:NitT/TauT family transport system substrate-binding protein